MHTKQLIRQMLIRKIDRLTDKIYDYVLHDKNYHLLDDEELSQILNYVLFVSESTMLHHLKVASDIIQADLLDSLKVENNE